MSDDEIQKEAQKAAEEFMKQNHELDSESSSNPYANDEIGDDGTSDKSDTSQKTPEYLAPLGGAAGAFGSYKGFGKGILKPGQGVYSPSKVEPVVRPSARPSVRIEPTLNAPHLNEPLSALDHVSAPESATQTIVQSGRGQGRPTGRQMEGGHNWETNRQSLATKQGLSAPGAANAIVEAGPMVPTRGGVAIPQNVSFQLEEEAQARAQAQAQAEAQTRAQAQIAQEQAAAEREAADRAAQAQAERSAGRKGAAIGAGKAAAKVGLGALGGAMALPDFYEAYQEYKKNGMSDEAIIKLLQGIGGAAAVVPNPITEIGGMGLAAAAPYLVKKFGPHNKPSPH